MAKPEIATTKIEHFVSTAKRELENLGIMVDGRRSDEILNMAREQRNKTRSCFPATPRDLNKMNIGT